jgi:sugar lactone lactonase YvrE
MVYAASGNTAPTRTITGCNTGLQDPLGIARDAAGNLYVANGGASTITVYDPAASGDVAPTRTIAGGNTGLTNPHGITLDGAGNLYVADDDGGPGSILVFAAGANGNATPTRTIAGSLDFPTGIALDAAGRIYVANEDNNSMHVALTVYPPGATGNAAPIATAVGTFPETSYPQGVALDAAARLYVTNPGYPSTGNVTVYAMGASGTLTPTARIAGGNTGLSFPKGIALDAAGRIYVANTTSITVYETGASGNAAPIATIVGGNTGLAGATYITF